MPDSPLTIILAGGGTGGHLYPGIAVAEALKSVLPAARPLFLCTTREIDRVILTPTGFEFIPQPIVPPRFADVLKVIVTWRQTRARSAKFSPTANPPSSSASVVTPPEPPSDPPPEKKSPPPSSTPT